MVMRTEAASPNSSIGAKLYTIILHICLVCIGPRDTFIRVGAGIKSRVFRVFICVG